MRFPESAEWVSVIPGIPCTFPFDLFRTGEPELADTLAVRSIGILGGPGMLGPWDPGILGSWNPGALESWDPGMLGSWDPGSLGSHTLFQH